MALQRDTYYPGRYSTGDAAHPQGAFKNRTTPTSQDGSYLEKDWLNDWDGFFASLLDEAGITPDDSIDEVGASQYYDALHSIFDDILSAAANGYTIMSSGLIIQWVDTGLTNTVTSGQSLPITWPIAFPNSIFAVCGITDVAGTTSGYVATVANRTITGCNVTYYFTSQASSTGQNTIIAIGY